MGVNPSLTIAALAEHAMSRVPPRDGEHPASGSAGDAQASARLD
jgi:hypothetical protein